MAVKYKRGKDGYFQARVWDGTYTASGKKHYIRVRSKQSSRDLERQVAELNRKREQREGVIKSNETFLDYARTWRKLYKAQRSANTKAMYDNIIETHFSALAGIRLQEIDRIHLRTLLNKQAGHNRTQQQIYMAFKQVIRSAVADQLFPAAVADNIFNNIDRPAYSAKEKRPLTPYEKEAVFAADFLPQDKAYVYLIYGCGLRREEAMALTIFDFNFKDHTVTINKAHEYTKGAATQKDPKTERGYRTIPVPDRVFGALKDYVGSLKASGCTYLFAFDDGKPLDKNAYERMWRRIIRQMRTVSDQEIVGLTAHIFRHNYCTDLCYQIPKISIKHIAYLLGDTEQMVLNVYNHIVMEKEDAALAVNAAL
ncbi:MAG: site-specific integrase [Clostridiales bacterium]|nr:site-specific integrase [Clostridiales bacterium]